MLKGWGVGRPVWDFSAKTSTRYPLLIFVFIILVRQILPMQEKYMPWRVDFLFNNIGVLEKYESWDDVPLCPPRQKLQCCGHSFLLHVRFYYTWWYLFDTYKRGGGDCYSPCYFFLLSSSLYKKCLFHGPVISPFTSPPYVVVVAADFMYVIICFGQYQYQWSLNYAPPPPLISIRYSRGGRHQFEMENETQPNVLNSHSPWISLHNAPIDWWEWITRV